MKKSILFLLYVCLFFSSCKKFLNTKPTDFVNTPEFYKSPAEIQQGLTGVYSVMRYTGFYGQIYYEKMNAATDESFYYNTGLGPAYWLNEAANADVYNLWVALYRGVNYANSLMDNLDSNSTTVDAAVIRRARGEALFLRSYYFFMLTQWWGGVPMPLHATSSASEGQIARTPLKQVYDQIISDMTLADTLLRDQTSSSLGYAEKASRTVVEGMLARVCLYAAGAPLKDISRYKDALYWAQKVVNSGEHSLNTDYKQIFINQCQDKYDVKESMWEVGFGYFGKSNPLNITGVVGVNIGVSNTYSVTSASGAIAYDSGYCYGYLKLHPRLYFAYGEDDLRRDWNCANYIYTNGVQVPLAANKYWERSPAKWRRQYETSSRAEQRASSTNFPLLRYADVLLMLAEAENEVNGPTGVAYNAINQVRRRAYGFSPNAPNTISDFANGLSQQAFRDSVKNERYRELAFENLRVGDLRRWGVLVQTVKSMANDINGLNAPIPVLTGTNYTNAMAPVNNITDRDIYLPLPLTDITLNRKLTQNPGF